MDNHQEEQEKVIEENDEDGGWVDTHHYAGTGSAARYHQIKNLLFISYKFVKGFLVIIFLITCYF